MPHSHVLKLIPALKQAEQQSKTIAPSTMPPPTAAFERLLDQADPQGQALDTATRQARRLCGRWLAWSRLQLGLTSEHVTQATNLDEQTLLLLESGLADATQVSDTDRSRLSHMLATMPHDEKWVLKVLSIALGQTAVSDEQAMHHVSTELESQIVTTDKPIHHRAVTLVEHDGYELFRYAILNRDEDAWTEVSERYRPLLIAWAVYYSAKNGISENGDDIADQTLARAWRAISPARFAQFQTLAAVLAYLRTCVTAVVIDYARAQNAILRAVHKIETLAVPTPEQVVLDEMVRSELWRLVNQIIETEQERVVLFETFLLDLPPRAILARNPHLFANIAAIYNVKRNLLGRLQHNDELRRLHREFL